MKKLSKIEAQKQIEEFFSNVQDKNAKEIKRIKRFAMKHNISLKEKRKLFCKHCLMPYSGKEKIRIKNKIKRIKCKNCDYVARWKVKSNSS